MKRFLLTVQFMTRIPVNKSLDIKREDFSKGVRYFPIIGLIIGGIVYLSVYLLSNVFSSILTGLIGTIIYIFITGGLHLDGFSDTCDGIFSGRTKDRILEIMKDSRLGTYGGVGLIIIILMRFSLYYELITLSTILPIMILSPVVSRSIVVFFMYKRKYARENEGLGDLFIGSISIEEVIINQLLLTGCILLLNYKLLICYLITLILMITIRRSIEKKLEGLTGDVLGFSIELSDIIFMLVSMGIIRIWN